MQEETSSDSLVLFLLLGASNLARGYSMLTQHLSECPEKTEFFIDSAFNPNDELSVLIETYFPNKKELKKQLFPN